jgi:tetratricopeptide (TPR) repeat protein
MPDYDRSAPSVSDADPNAITGVGSGSTSSVPPSAVQRYTLGEEIARGGMGVVYRATDTTLGREVAVKVLHEKYGPDSGVARRFADEARIAGQLQHPAIPPVHDLGTLPNGQPFLAMKLIKGATLDRLLEARPDPAADRGRFVAVFEQVCQALAYAHSHNVIHRDLKPANVMVGTYGEVQVMDWGLAKVLTSRIADTADPVETTGETQVVSVRDSDGSFTQAGSVLGTPAFMPPEQAAGAVGKVDIRSDVFGLGAVLAVILTGRPPFAAGSAETVRVEAAQGKVEECFARLDACAADPELVALCKQCLSPNPADRPADAGAVAKAVANLRSAAEDRARRAELDRAQAQARMVEQRKRRRVQLALAVSVGVLLVAGGATAWWQADQARARRDRHARDTEALKTLLDQCEEALRANNGPRAAVALNAAEKQVAEIAGDALAGRLDRLRADLAAKKNLDEVDEFRWTMIDGKLPHGPILAARFRAAIEPLTGPPATTPADRAAEQVAGSAVRDRLVAALDRWLGEEKLDWVRAVLQAADPDSFRDAIRDATRAGNGAQVAALASQADAANQPPWFAAVLGENTDVPIRQRFELLSNAVRRRPTDLWLLMAMGNQFRANSRAGAEARARWYQAAIAVAPDNPSPHVNMGIALFDQRDLIGAEAEYQQALRLNPNSAIAHNGLGTVLKDNGDLAGAEAQYRKALRLDPKFAYAHYDLGIVLSERRAFDGAIAAYEAAIRLDPDFAEAHNNLGWALQEKGNLDRAITEFKKAFRIDPKHALAHCNLGNVLRAKGDLSGAIAEYEKAVEINPNYNFALTNLRWAERMLELEPRLPDILAGRKPAGTPAEACALANLCAEPIRKKFVAAVKLYEMAFATDPPIAQANLMSFTHRYEAACYAARAARGEGTDAPDGASERAALRAKALDWLRADLVPYRKQAASTVVVERMVAADNLSHWLIDSDLSGVRDSGPLSKLPAAERAEWEKLWADVKVARADARKPVPPPRAGPGKN